MMQTQHKFVLFTCQKRRKMGNSKLLEQFAIAKCNDNFSDIGSKFSYLQIFQIKKETFRLFDVSKEKKGIGSAKYI